MSWGRWAPLSGIVFVALWVVAFVLLVAGDPGDTDAEILSFYADSGNRGQRTLALFLIITASLFFLWFLGVLRDALASAEGKAGPFTALMFGAGLVATALWLVAGVLFMAVAYTEDQDNRYSVDPNTHRLVAETAYLIWVSGIPVALTGVLAVSLLSRRTRFLPIWLTWFGMAASVTMVFFLAVAPFFVFLAWVLAVSVVLIRRPATQPGATAAAES